MKISDEITTIQVKTYYVKSKVCNTCNMTKPLSDFNRRKKSAFSLRNTAEGRRNKCRECSIAYQRKWRNENAEQT